MITCEHCGKVYQSNVTPLRCRCGGSTGVTTENSSVEYNHWAPLHYYAVKHRGSWGQESARLWYFNEWLPRIPKSCGCKEKWIEMDLKPDFSSPQSFFEWTWHAHDVVNEELGKAYRPSLAECYAIWWR